ncbi:multiheme c-type cytochrome [Carboxylicivirga marina]|uniref:Cytochrome c-552/4 domain-containing protein n=1 Tax=Carboxylicivirga marina TaxID=2800988 RepID=A0ABS1HE07_9BACT|nr:multiheme c-type cytochrome [Carboxylicivirga marina]MBK3515889.1 hypothetical protein [Carboxylicivirga marina]
MNIQRLLLLICLVLGANLLNAQNKYIGAAKCKMCHNKPATGQQYTKWTEANHSKAWQLLSAEEQKDPKCAKCHSTAMSVDASLHAGIKVEEGVSCESCHGPGSAYKSPTVMKSREASMAKGLILPTEDVCKKCHNEESPHYKGFNYEEYLAKIAHTNPKK